MKIRLINPRGRVVEIDEKEGSLKTLLQNGFSYAPEGVEAGKAYNPVFDRGQNIEPPVKDTRVEQAAISGDLLRVIKL